MPAFGLVVNGKNEILLIQRGYGKDRGKWSLPGGMRDRGESLKGAAVRETLEETGIRMSADTLYYKNKSGRLETWRGRDGGGNIKIQKKECWDAKWFQLDMLPHDDMLAFGPDKIVIGKWARESLGSRRVHYPRVQMRRAGFALVVNERLEVLLVREEGRQRRGSWRLPGGITRKAEKRSDAAGRETRNATGVTIAVPESILRKQTSRKNLSGRACWRPENWGRRQVVPSFRPAIRRESGIRGGCANHREMGE